MSHHGVCIEGVENYIGNKKKNQKLDRSATTNRLEQKSLRSNGLRYCSLDESSDFKKTSEIINLTKRHC